MTGIQQTDDAMLNFIQGHMHTPFLDSLMPWVSFLGNGAMVWIAVAVLLLLIKQYRSSGFLILIVLLLCFLIGDVLLKQVIARPRPFIDHPAITLLIPPPTDYSFPSGHTDSSFAAATILLFRKKSWGIAATLLASLIAFSRLYLYVHYPSDVLAGLILGITVAFITNRLFRSNQNRHSNANGSNEMPQ
jgi:Membrane-associated phospholipid phosphatase